VDAELFTEEEQAAPTPKRSSRETVVVIGAGGAGLTAAEQVRSLSDARIVLVNKEPVLPYNRLNLTRYLAGAVSEQELTLRPERWFREQEVELVAGAAHAIDRSARFVELSSGQRLPYDRLILANGAHPFMPPVPGASREGVSAVRTLAHANSVLRSARPGMRCVCVGGGLLGLEAAAALNGRGVAVTVLEGFDWLLPRQLSRPAAARVAAYLEGLGIQIRCSAKLVEILGDESVRAVRLADELELPADLVLFATGVRPNKHLAMQAGLETRQGVVVNDALATSDPAIFAAGDVAEHRGVVHGLWTTALEQGTVAGRNAAGSNETFRGAPPANQLKVLDLPVFSVGVFDPTDATFSVHEDADERAYRRLVTRDGAIVGVNLVGDMKLAASLKRAVDGRTQLAELPPELRALPELARSRREA
jgi:nitrite reductase (NADH) large subunit